MRILGITLGKYLTRFNRFQAIFIGFSPTLSSHHKPTNNGVLFPRIRPLRARFTYLGRSNLGWNQGGQLSSDDERRHDDVNG